MSFNDQIYDITILRGILLESLKTSYANKLSKAYLDILNDMIKQLKTYDNVDIKNVNQVIKELQQRIDPKVILLSDMQELALVEASYIPTAINAVAGYEIFKRIPRDSTLLKIANGDLFQGHTISQVLKNFDTKIAYDLQDEVKVAVMNGETIPQIRERLNRLMNVKRSQAETIARTATATLVEQVRMATYGENADVIRGYMSVSVLDGRVSDICLAYADKFYDINKKPVGHSLPFKQTPRHMNCLTGNTLVSTRYPISNIYRRAYKGDIYTITTASGNFIECTPNHPILTSRGFVHANTITKLDKIATELSSKGNFILDDKNNQPHVRVEDFFSSCRVSTEMASVLMPVSSEDFHGDVTDKEVEVVSIERELWFKLYPMRSETVSDSNLIMTNDSTHGVSSFNKRFFRNFNPLGSFMTCLNLIKSFFLVHKRPLHSFLFGLISNLNALSNKFLFKNGSFNSKSISNSNYSDSMIIESDTNLKHNNTMSPEFEVKRDSTALYDDSIDNPISDSELATNIANGTMGHEVFFDDVVSVDIRKNVFTHVYNLENNLHYYTANNLISHNCRSLHIAVVKSFKEMGIEDDKEIPEATRSSLDGAVPQSTTMEQWLKSKDKAFVEKTLGKGRADLFLKGKISLSDLVKKNSEVRTIKELKELSQ